MFILCTKGPAIWVCACRGPMQLVEAANGAGFGCRIVAIAILLDVGLGGLTPSK